MKHDQLKLGALCTATFMLLLDITIVQAALPQIRADLGGDVTSLQWTIDAYLLPLASLIITFGAVADRIGRRRVFVLGVAVFTAGSLACAMASTMGSLDAFRGVQGIGGAAMFATTLALISQEFAPAVRGHAVLAWGTTVGAAVACGPLLGGLLTEYANWRWIFLINVPLGAVVLVFTTYAMGEGRDQTGRRVDLPGLVTLTLGLTLLIGGLLRASASDWQSHPAMSSVGLGIAALAAFAASQTRPHAMLDRVLLANRSFRGVSLATIALGAGMFSSFLFITIYLQGALGMSPVASGVRLLAATVPVMVVPVCMRRLRIAPVSGRLIGVGLTLITAGLVASTWAAADSSSLRVLPGLVLAGVGIGLASTCVAATALAVAPPNRSGLASGVSNTCRLGGIAIGVAVLGVAQRAGVAASLSGAPDSVRTLIATGSLHDAASRLGAGGLADAQTAFTSGLHWALLTAAVVSLGGAVTAFASIRASTQGSATTSNTSYHAVTAGTTSQERKSHDRHAHLQ